MAIAENKSERIEVRTTSNMKALLQRAAASSHKNVTGFCSRQGSTPLRTPWSTGGFSGSTIASGRPSRLSSSGRRQAPLDSIACGEERAWSDAGTGGVVSSREARRNARCRFLRVREKPLDLEASRWRTRRPTAPGMRLPGIDGARHSTALRREHRHADAPLRVGKGQAHEDPGDDSCPSRGRPTWPEVRRTRSGQGARRRTAQNRRRRRHRRYSGTAVHADDEARGWYEAFVRAEPHGSLSPVLAHEGPAGNVERTSIGDVVELVESLSGDSVDA